MTARRTTALLLWVLASPLAGALGGCCPLSEPPSFSLVYRPACRELDCSDAFQSDAHWGEGRPHAAYAGDRFVLLVYGSPLEANDADMLELFERRDDGSVGARVDSVPVTVENDVYFSGACFEHDEVRLRLEGVAPGSYWLVHRRETGPPELQDACCGVRTPEYQPFGESAALLAPVDLR